MEMTVLGKWVIIVALFATAGSAIFYFRAATRKVSPAFPRSLMHVMLFLLTLASALLLTLLLRHDFSNGYVYSYSDRALPIHFLLSSFYAGQEGSFLFWALCGGYIGLVLQRFTKSRGNEAAVMTVFMVVQAFFLLMVAVKSPFQSLHEMFPEAPAGFAAADGRGLNPLLQNFWMVIHPPVLFVGFAAMAAPFSLAIAGLWKKDFTVLSRARMGRILVLGSGRKFIARPVADRDGASAFDAGAAADRQIRADEFFSGRDLIFSGRL
jgi:cytochrome c-type biogenesis protein CcmF